MWPSGKSMLGEWDNLFDARQTLRCWDGQDRTANQKLHFHFCWATMSTQVPYTYARILMLHKYSQILLPSCKCFTHASTASRGTRSILTSCIESQNGIEWTEQGEMCDKPMCAFASKFTIPGCTWQWPNNDENSACSARGSSAFQSWSPTRSLSKDMLGLQLSQAEAGTPTN